VDMVEAAGTAVGGKIGDRWAEWLSSVLGHSLVGDALRLSTLVTEVSLLSSCLEECIEEKNCGSFVC